MNWRRIRSSSLNPAADNGLRQDWPQRRRRTGGQAGQNRAARDSSMRKRHMTRREAHKERNSRNGSDRIGSRGGGGTKWRRHQSATSADPVFRLPRHQSAGKQRAPRSAGRRGAYEKPLKNGRRKVCLGDCVGDKDASSLFRRKPEFTVIATRVFALSSGNKRRCKSP